MSAKQTATEKVLNHPDKDELISKLLLGISPQDISENLAIRYSNPAEKKFVLSVKTLQTFKNNSLDIYKIIQADLAKTKALATSTDQELQMAIQGSSAYKETLEKLAGQELDVKTSIVNMITALNLRIEQIFNEHQMDPANINTRTERIFNEMIAQWRSVMELYHKYVLQAPDQIIQHNMTITHIDQHVEVIRSAIMETLAMMDIESSLKFFEIFTEKMEKLKAPTEIKILPAEERLAEVRVVNDQINTKLTE
jgi:hypothetical protein